jgi:acyl-CoA synthetase (AMP-forming)/AMP-acid ligase II
MEDADSAVTYADLEHDSSRVAAVLKATGLGPGEPVLVLVGNRPADWCTCLAVWRERGVVVPVHRDAPAAVVADLLARTRARVVLDASAEFAALAGNPEASAEGPALVLNQPPPPDRPLLRGAAVIVFTSGTTGTPKGTVLSHVGLAGKLEVLRSVMGFSVDTRTLLILQMTFSFGIWVSLLTLLQGGRLIMRGRFDREGLMATLREARISTAAMVPSMIRTLLAGAPPSAEDLREAGASLRTLIVGGETLGLALYRRVRELWPDAALYDVYGTTETATSDFILRPQDQPALAGTLGVVTEGVEYRVVDGRGLDVVPGEIGELLLRSRFVMSGYLDEPQRTRESFLEGYFRSGDLVRARPDGGLEPVGRNKEIISRGGNKVSPLEVEAALIDHPGVAEAIVAGVPDERLGERIHALVVLAAAEGPREAELKAWVADRLGRFKAPDVIHYGSEIPRGRTGKADRGGFRAWALAHRAAADGAKD